MRSRVYNLDIKGFGAKRKEMNLMKKNLCMVIAAVTVFGVTVSAAADTETFYDALNKPVYSAENSITMTMSLDSMSDELKDAMGLTFETAAINYSINSAYNMSEDGKVMQMVYDMTMSMPGMDDITMTNYIDMDMSNEDDIKYLVITKSPDNEKYSYIDYGENSDLASIVNMTADAVNSDEMKELAEQLSAAVPQKEPEYKDGVYSLTYSEQEIKDMLRATMLAGEQIYLPMFNEMMAVTAGQTVTTESASAGGAEGPTDIYISGETEPVIGGAEGPTDVYIAPGEIDSEEYRAEVEKWYGILSGVKLFAEDAVTLDVTLDENNDIKTMDMGMYIETNLYDTVTKIAEAVGASEEDLAGFSEYVTPENSDIKASLVMSCEYENVNGDVTVDIPELTEENSVNMLDGIAAVTMDVDLETVTVEGMELIPLRAFCNAIGIADDDITYDNGIVTVIARTRVPERTVTDTINDTHVNVVNSDGSTTSIELPRPAVLINDRTYVTSEFAFAFDYLYDNGTVFDIGDRTEGSE